MTHPPSLMAQAKETKLTTVDNMSPEGSAYSGATIARSIG